MIELYSVIYCESVDSGYSQKYFYLNQKRSASNFARVASKKSGKRSQIFKCSGYYDAAYKFCEVESSNVAVYIAGKRC